MKEAMGRKTGSTVQVQAVSRLYESREGKGKLEQYLVEAFPRHEFDLYRCKIRQ